MPSPFPGMDPYIESWIWGDFHGSLCQAVRDRLNAQLPKRYIASTELKAWRVDKAERLLMNEPDIVIEGESARTAGGVPTIAAPINTILHGVVRKQRYIKIIDSEERRIVTVIEVLSQSNKTESDDRQAYRLKREESVASGISLVEIDLLRNGQRPPVPIPLDLDVPDAVLDLKSCMDHVYDFGRYAEQLDYSKPPKPPLREPDATWARELLANRTIPT